MDFLKNNVRFSFLYRGKNAFDGQFAKTIKEQKNTLITTYIFENGLKVTNIAKKYPKYDAYEWVNYFENTSTSPTDIISELWDCDSAFSIEHEEDKKPTEFLPSSKTSTKIYAPCGSACAIDEFYCDVDAEVMNQKENYIFPGTSKEYSPVGGRSSDTQAPFFNVHKNGKGYIFAVGWTGQWKAKIGRTNDNILFKSKVEDTHFKLLPGEKFRTSSVVVMAYEGDFIHSQNKWRRLLKEHFSLIGKDEREKHGPLCAPLWGGLKTDEVINVIDIIKKNKLPFEYLWIDAGWYGINTIHSKNGFEGDWPLHTGDWRESRNIHPEGFAPVAKAISDANMKFLLWFEPERVIRTTPHAVANPDYYLWDGNENGVDYLLNLGEEKAWNYCFETLSSFIENYNIRCYRQDINFSPLPFWRKNDTVDRVGIREIKHINGLYMLWDALLERFPSLIIDNCASGGRRIDIETLRRSIPLWRSDYQCPADYKTEGSQCHNLTYNMWIPYSGVGTNGDASAYNIRSVYAPALAISAIFSNSGIYKNPDIVKKYAEEYLKIRHYFTEDFYPLTEYTQSLDTWCAMQYDRPSEKDGIVLIFRREKSYSKEACFNLYEIDKKAEYLFTDLDGGEFYIDGKTLVNEGFCITLQKRESKIFLYKKISNK